MQLTVLLLNLVFGLLPQQSTFTLVGSVRDQTGRAVSGVRLTVIDENYQMVQSSFVDSSGRFRARGLRMGKYTVRVETSGTSYEEQSQQIELQSLRRLGGDETIPMEFRLKLKKGNEPSNRAGSVFAQDVPKAARTEYDRGVNQVKRNQTDAAIAAFKHAVTIFPDYFDALELLGIEYTKDGQYESAVESLTRAIGLNSRSPKSLYAIGVAYLNLHRLPEAVEWLHKAAQLDPNNPNTQMMLGLAYGNGGALDKSEAAFKRALQLGGAAAAEAHFYLAGLFNKQGKYDEARQELELLLKESKSIKDLAQIKAMIAKLKEKEKVAPSPAASFPSSSSSVPSDSARAQTRGDAQLQTLNSTGAATGTAEPEKPPAPAVTAPIPPDKNALLTDPVQPLPPEMMEVIERSGANGGAMHKRLLDYTYLLKKTRRVLDKRGNAASTEEQVFEAYPIRGEHVLIRLSTNGVPSAMVSDDRRRAVKQLDEAERRRDQPAAGSENDGAGGKLDYISAGVSGIYGGKPGYVSINVSAFLRACEFFSPRTEKIAGRETLVLNFRRRAGIILPSNQSYISKLVGTVWIDQADQIISRLEAWSAAQSAFDLLQSTAPRDDAALIYQQQRQVNGLWVPTLIRMNAGGRAELFDGLNWDVIFEFSNFQRFDASAGDAIIKPPDKDPQR